VAVTTRPPITGDKGIALLHVVLLMAMLTVLTGGAAMLARVEVLISGHHRAEREAAYAAQAMLAVVFQDLDRVIEWNEVLSGSRSASFADGALGMPRQIPGGGTVHVCCGAGTLTDRLHVESGLAWRPFAWHSLSGLLGATPAGKYYLAAWVVDDDADGDGDPLRDANGRLVVRAEAVTTLGLRKAVEATVERAPPDPVSGSRPSGLEMLNWREIR
jgi:hypothetical protein